MALAVKPRSPGLPEGTGPRAPMAAGEAGREAEHAWQVQWLLAAQRARETQPRRSRAARATVPHDSVTVGPRLPLCPQNYFPTCYLLLQPPPHGSRSPRGLWSWA